MKVVLFCGGLGHADARALRSVPKPMVPIGYRPILWHVMKYYAHFGHKDFILCLGYKAEVIKEYFLNYNEALANDFVLSRRRQRRPAAEHRHPGLEHHLRRHRPATPTSASGCGPSATCSATTRSSSPTTPTG